MENFYFKSPIDHGQTRIPSHIALVATLLGDEVTHCYLTCYSITVSVLTESIYLCA